MLTHLTNRLKQTRRDEHGSAMIFAISFLLVLMLLSTVVVGAVATQALAARATSLRAALSTAATMGIESVIHSANNATNGETLLANYQTTPLTGQPAEGTLNIPTNGGTIKWEVKTTKLVQPDASVAYAVTSLGYSTATGKTNGITYRAVIQGVPVNKGVYVNNRAEYYLNPASAWFLGITAEKNVNFKAGSILKSNNSLTTTVNPGPTATTDESNTVFSNSGNLTVTANTHKINSFTTGTDYDPVSGATLPVPRCTTAALCNTLPDFYTSALHTSYSLKGVDEAVKTACPAAPTSYPVWRASEQAGNLNAATNQCWSQLIFDVNTTLPATYSRATPMTMYVTGTVEVANNVKVNKTKTPSALLIYSTGASFNNTATADTNMMFASYTANCNIAATSIYFGGLACGTVDVLTDNLFVDTASKVLPSSSTARKIWVETYREQI